jgi:hypothetical protein
MVRDVPLHEITLRKYEKPYDSSKREIVRKICLSLGLLQPGDSRDIVVDILLALEESRKDKKELTSFEVRDIVTQMRQNNSLEVKGIAESNIRRQLKRLRDLMIVEKKNNLYRVSEFATLHDLFEQKIEKFLIPQTIDRIKEYLGVLERQ